MSLDWRPELQHTPARPIIIHLEDFTFHLRKLSRLRNTHFFSFFLKQFSSQLPPSQDKSHLESAPHTHSHASRPTSAKESEKAK